MSKRDEYIANLKAQLEEWNAEVRKWEAKAKEAQADVRMEYEKHLEALRRHDPGASEAAMRLHIRRSVERLEQEVEAEERGAQ